MAEGRNGPTWHLTCSNTYLREQYCDGTFAYVELSRPSHIVMSWR